MSGKSRQALILSFDGSKDTDLRKKRMRKSLFPDLQKGLYQYGDSDWAGKFWGTDMHVDALKAQKEIRQLSKQRDALYEKYDYDGSDEERQRLSPIQRAKRQQKRDADFKRLRDKEKVVEKTCYDLEEKLLDHKISEAEAERAERKMRAKKGVAGMAVAAGKTVAGQARKFTGQPGAEVESGARQGAALARQAMTKKCSTPGAKIRSSGKGKGKARGKGVGPIGEPVAKASDSPDVDFDAGYTGVADYSGEVAMRVKPNPKCNGCLHYDSNQVACRIGVLPSVCGDGSFPEIGFAPANPSRVAGKNQTQIHSDAVAVPARGEDHTVINEIPYRIEVLGDSALTLSERMSLLKSSWDIVKGSLTPEKARKILHDKKVHGKPLTDQQRKYFGAVASGTAKKSEHALFLKSEVESMIGERVFLKSNKPVISKGSSIDEFADAMGTTVDVVRDIARRLGSKAEFAEFVKSKLPDIMMSHGLDETDIGQLYRQAVKMVKSLSDVQWLTWKGYDFSAGVSDESLSRAIENNGGLLDHNVVHGVVTPREPVQALPFPEPLQPPNQDPVPMGGFVGGNLHLSDLIGRLG